MKKRLIGFIDKVMIFLFYHSTNSRKTFHELERINYKESANFIHQYGGRAVLLDEKKKFWKHAINQSPSEGLILEFGVFQGQSINYFSDILGGKADNRNIFGFDSFEGLSEDWAGTNMLRGTFDQKGRLPKVNSNVKLVKGWIDDTLPPFLSENIDDHKIAFMHIDMDTYSPTKVIFENTVDFLKPGTIIAFDELLGYPGWRNNEYRALMELIAPKWDFEYISFCEPKFRGRHKSPYIRGAIRITKSKTRTETN